MHRCCHHRRCRIQAAAYHPTQFPVRVCTLCGYKSCTCMQDKIALDLFPGKVKFIFCKPDITTGTAENIALAGSLVNGGTFSLDRTYVVGAFKKSKVNLCIHLEISKQKKQKQKIAHGSPF